MLGFGFLNSLFLFGLAAIVLPIVIHILNRRRQRKIDFSSLEFIMEMSRRRMSKVNLRRWLILALRTLAVLLIVLAFARPTMQDSAAFFMGGDAPKNIVVCMDVSGSMGAELETGTALSFAATLAKSVVDQAGDRDVINIVAFTTRADILFSGGTRNKQVVRGSLDDLSVRPEGTEYGAAIQAAVEAATTSGVRGGEIYIVSDFRAVPDSLNLGEVPGDLRVLLLPVYAEAVDNVSIDRVFTPRKLIRPGEVIRVGVAVTNHSRQQPVTFPLELYVDGRRKAEKVVELAPVSSATVNFALSLNEWGRHTARVAKHHDRLPVDDDRFFLLEVSQKIPVLLIRGRKLTEDGQKTAGYFYVDKALNPRGSAEGEFVVRTIDEADLTTASLPGRGVVVWTDPEHLDRSRFDLLKRFVHGGGAGLVFLGPSRKGFWREPAFAEYIGAQKSSVRERADGERFASFQNEHPVFSLFNEEELELLSMSRLRRWVSVSGVPTDSVLAYLGNGDPAIWECKRGAGRLLVVSAAPDLPSGDLPLSPMFLPLIHTSVSYLASTEVAGVHQENYAGEDLFFELPSDWSNDRPLVVRDDQGDDWQPAIFESAQGEPRVMVSRARAVGFYRLYADTAMVGEAAVNIDTRESNLNPRELKGDVGGAHVIDTTGDVVASIDRERQGREVYALFLLLAIAVLAVESILGRKA